MIVIPIITTAINAKKLVKYLSNLNVFIITQIYNANVLLLKS